MQPSLEASLEICEVSKVGARTVGHPGIRRPLRSFEELTRENKVLLILGGSRY